MHACKQMFGRCRRLRPPAGTCSNSSRPASAARWNGGCWMTGAEGRPLAGVRVIDTTEEHGEMSAPAARRSRCRCRQGGAAGWFVRPHAAALRPRRLEPLVRLPQLQQARRRARRHDGGRSDRARPPARRRRRVGRRASTGRMGRRRLRHRHRVEAAPAPRGHGDHRLRSDRPVPRLRRHRRRDGRDRRDALPSGELGRPPLLTPGYLAYDVASTTAAFFTLAALWRRGHRGKASTWTCR